MDDINIAKSKKKGDKCFSTEGKISMVTYSMERPSRLASVWRSNSTSWVKADLFFHKALSEFFKDRLKINILGSTKRNINCKLLKKERKSRNFQNFGEGVVFF